MGVLKGGADWGRVVGGFFNQVHLDLHAPLCRMILLQGVGA
jgi:hypothetical protein